jgi:UDP:flavonoid glycosyltransferase YjiC (YdhE family)
VRVLVSVNDAVGHVLPVLPLARALCAAGHEVLLASPGPAAGRLASITGVTVRALPAAEVPLLDEPPPPGDHEGRLSWAVRRSWPNDARGWVGPLLECAREWRPDVVVVEPVEHAGRVVAAALGLPLVEHGWGFTLPAGSASSATAGILDLYDAHATAPTEPALRLDLGPAVLQAPDIPAGVDRYRFEPWSTQAPLLPDPRPGRPRVLVTLGTFDNRHAADRLRSAVRAVASLPVEVVVALGNTDRGGAHGFPEGVVVAEWLDAAREVPRCAAVVHHAGAGLSMTSVTAGVPALCLPQGADQFRNAALLSGTGSALVIEPGSVDPASVVDAVRVLLDDDRVRAAAQEVSRRNDALPPVAAALLPVTQLVGPSAA